MNFDFGKLIQPYLEQADIPAALSVSESRLRQLPASPFHAVIGQSLLHHVQGLVEWTDRFYTRISQKNAVRSLCFELNEIDIQTHSWHVDAFAYSTEGDLNELDWLNHFAAKTMPGSEFILTGYEKLQQAFHTIDADSHTLQDARDWCEQIVIVRLMELVYAAHLEAAYQRKAWAALPVYCTANACDVVVLSPKYVAQPLG
jgi:hypothetical protein